MAIPQNGPFASARVHEDDGEFIGGSFDDPRHRHVNPFLDKAVSGNATKLVVAKAPDISRAPAKTRARDQGRRRLPSGKASESLEALFAVGRGIFGHDRD